MLIYKIEDVSDPRVSMYRDLKDKHLRQQNSFIVEGKFILDVFISRSKYKISSVFIAEERLLPLDALLQRLPPNVPVYISNAETMAAIAGYHVHRGILAAGSDTDYSFDLPTKLMKFKRIAVLSNIANPDNIGSIFRNASGLGVEAILLDNQCCSPLYRKAIRVSMGATLTVPWSQNANISEIVSSLDDHGFSLYALSLQGAVLLDDIQFAERSAFVFGEEAYGLPLAVQDRCAAITIPMSFGTDSLNVAATSAIVFDAARRRQK